MNPPYIMLYFLFFSIFAPLYPLFTSLWTLPPSSRFAVQARFPAPKNNPAPAPSRGQFAGISIAFLHGLCCFCKDCENPFSPSGEKSVLSGVLSLLQAGSLGAQESSKPILPVRLFMRSGARHDLNFFQYPSPLSQEAISSCAPATSLSLTVKPSVMTVASGSSCSMV